MVSQMRNLENAARLAMGHADASIASRPVAPVAEGLLRRLMTVLVRLFLGR
jgi:hypothetical protein